MLTTIVTTLSLVSPMLSDDMTCPVMVGGKADMAGPSTVYAGVRVWFCCAGCDKGFAKNPTAYFKTAETSGKTIGMSLFDPVSGVKADATSTHSSVYKGVKYTFLTAKNKESFDAAPAKFTAMPKSEVLTCAVAGDKMSAPQDAHAYVDFKGVRYYICCAGCVPKMKADPAKYAKSASKLVAKATAHAVKSE